ncbi:Spore photoproduct lyase [hydrothermal vent metagenome]|uniref:Spore photoproduct lyase n=1 Tax=hydrothermal vent metagenome TaxID=652676 RepID=A0A1W1CSD9_9ZZZZ
MLYIVTALKPEAQAFVDYYKLKKSKLNGFTLFFNEKIKLIISGIGIEKARLATQTLINNFDITDDDTYLNIGICAASKNYAIGELIVCGGIVYQNQKYIFMPTNPLIYCVENALSSAIYPLADMESYGFYDAVIHNPAIKKFHIIKVVSDHFEPQKVTKEKTKSLLFNLVNAINKVI